MAIEPKTPLVVPSILQTRDEDASTSNADKVPVTEMVPAIKPPRSSDPASATLPEASST